MAIAIWRSHVFLTETSLASLHIFGSIDFIRPILFNGFYIYGFYFIFISYHWVNQEKYGKNTNNPERFG